MATDQYTKKDPTAGEPGAKPTNLKWPGLSKDMQVRQECDAIRSTPLYFLGFGVLVLTFLTR